MHAGQTVGAGDDRMLVYAVVAGQEVLDVVALQAGIEGILHVGIGVGVALEHGVLVALRHERLVGQHEGMVGAARALVEPAADPRLLLVIE